MTSITSSAATRSIRRNSFQNEHNKSLPQTSFKLINNMKMVSYSADDLVAKTITDECNVIVPLTIISSNNFDIHNKNHHRSRLKSFTSISNQNHLSSPTSTENDDESSEIIIVPNDIVMITTDSNLKRQGSLRLMDKKLIQPSSYYENIKLDKIPIQEQQGKEQQTVISPTVSWINSIGEDRIKDEDSTSNSSSDTSDDDDNDNRYDDDSTDDDSIHRATSHFIQARVRGAADRRLSLQHVLGLTDTSTSVNSPLSYHTCLICYHDKRLRPLTQCCQSPVCLECLQLYIGTHVNEAKIKIPCPIQECTYILTRDEILGYINHNQELKEKYKRFYADINKEINIKTCPKCCSILELDKKLFTSHKSSPRRVNCAECSFIWCFQCHSPWHEKMSCKDYTDGNKLLKQWANQYDENQFNAQQCPKCKVFISRNGGCPHMTCTKCSCDFCYNCGKRRLGMKFLGTHESRYSPLGCKYNLYPDKPALRRTVRGLVAGAIAVAAPVAAVGAVALLAVGATIGAPTYGTYRLVKHIRHCQQQRATTRSTIQNSQNIRQSTEIGDSDQDLTLGIIETQEERDLRLTIEASKETFAEEQRKMAAFGNENNNYEEINWEKRSSLSSDSSSEFDDEDLRGGQTPPRKSISKLTTDNQF